MNELNYLHLFSLKIGLPGTLAKEKRMYQFYKPNW